MASFNRIIIAGNLTRDPEYKQLTSGQAMCKLGLASNRQFKNKQTGNMVQEVCYVDIDVWGPQAESCRQYLQKGRPVLIEGRLKFDSWKDNEGQTRSKHTIVADRVVFLSSASASNDIVTANENSEEKIEPKNKMEKDLLDQIGEIKSRTIDSEKKNLKKNIVKKAKELTSSDDSENIFTETEFKDEPPFQDDLPF